jgi:hypothetical protein
MSDLSEAVETAKAAGTIGSDMGLLADVVADIEKVIIPRGGQVDGAPIQVRPGRSGTELSLTLYFPLQALREYNAQSPQMEWVSFAKGDLNTKKLGKSEA